MLKIFSEIIYISYSSQRMLLLNIISFCLSSFQHRFFYQMIYDAGLLYYVRKSDCCHVIVLFIYSIQL